jgi:hypothetical protein
MLAIQRSFQEIISQAFDGSPLLDGNERTKAFVDMLFGLLFIDDRSLLIALFLQCTRR